MNPSLCEPVLLTQVYYVHALFAGGDVEGDSLQVTEQDFLQALSSLVPSVSEGELQRYAQLKHTLGAQG